jgi:hypothetical protein
MTVRLTPRPLYYSSRRSLPRWFGVAGLAGAATVDAIGGQLCAVEQRGDPLAIVVARRHLHDHEEVGVLVEGDQVRLLRRPEELVFVSANTTSPTVAPWLRL